MLGDGCSIKHDHCGKSPAGAACRLNLIVKKSLDATPGLDDTASKTRWLLTYFKTSTTAKEKL